VQGLKNWPYFISHSDSFASMRLAPMESAQYMMPPLLAFHKKFHQQFVSSRGAELKESS
jgi:hypothetical protein